MSFDVFPDHMLFAQSSNPTLSRPTTRSSSANSIQSDVTAATTMSIDSVQNKPVSDGKFRETMKQIVRRWRNNEMTEDDIKYLERTYITDAEYILITEDFGLRHGVELVKNRLQFTEYPTGVHEFMTRKMDTWVDRAFGDSLDKLGSTSKLVQ
jgi:hypothetical protein